MRGAGGKIIRAVAVFAMVLSGASFASAADSGSHSVAYSVVSFRFLELGLTNGGGCPVDGATPTGATIAPTTAFATGAGEGCAVKFPTVRRGDVVEAAGGNLYYATTLSGDKVEVSIDTDTTNGVVLGVYVDGALLAGDPCGGGDAGTASFGATNRTLVANGTAAETPVVRSPVDLSSVATELITGISNCGAGDTASAAVASIKYVLDAQNASVSASPADSFSAVKVVTYTLKAGA